MDNYKYIYHDIYFINYQCEYYVRNHFWFIGVCLIWFFTSQSAIFQLCQDGSSWAEPVLSKDKCVLLKDTTKWAREAQTCNPSVLSQALYHWTTALRTFINLDTILVVRELRDI